MIPAGAEKRAIGLAAGLLAMAAPRRLLGLDAGDWSMILVGLVLSGLLLAFV